MSTRSSRSSRDALSQVPARKRRQAAATLGLFATLFVAIAAVAATGASTPVLKAFVGIAIVAALFLALLAWGIASSIKTDAALQVGSSLDAAIEQAVAASGQPMCGCGHEHDPSELHVPDDPCARDGHGSGCTHSCDTCVLATMKRIADRPSPTRRPSPLPR